jgi:hypothetical protein
VSPGFDCSPRSSRHIRGWWRRRDSNPRPPGCKPGALPTELRPRLELVGLSGLEPLTSRLSGGRSNQLSYRPEQAVDLSTACHQLNGVEWEGWPLSPCDHPIVRRPDVPPCEGPFRASNQSVRKEVIQPQVPLRLPCYDLVPITELAFGAALPKVEQSDFEHSPLSWLDGRCVQGSGTYSPRHG